MVVNWLEIGIQTAIIVALLAVVGAYARYRVVPRLRTQAGEWAGAAIGRFWQKLMEDAQKESEGGGGEGAPAGALNIGGFKIDAGTLRSIAEILKVVQSMGFLKGMGGGGEHPLLK